MAILNSFTAPAVKTSNFDLSTTITFSTTPGVITPFYHRTTYPGDKFFIKAECGLETLPLQSPLWSNFRSRIAWYWLSWRAVSPTLHYNVGTIDPRTIVFPSFIPPLQDVVSAQIPGIDSPGLPLTQEEPDGTTQYVKGVIAPSSLLNYLYYQEFTLLGCDDDTSSDEYEAASALYTRNGIPFYMYYSVFYHYYANWQEANFPIVNKWSSSPFVSPTVGNFYSQIPLSELQGDILTVGLSRSQINLASPDRSIGLKFFGTAPAATIDAARFPYGGLCLCTHAPDMLTALISSASRDSIAAASVIDTSGGSFTVDSFIGAEKIKKYLELGFFNASGFRDWVYAQFGVTPPADCGVPSLLGYTDTYVNFSTIVANSADGLGQLGSRGTGHKSSRLRRFNFTEFGTLMAIHTLSPLVTYGGIPRLEDSNLKLSDYASPVMNAIQWQPLLRYQRINRLPYVRSTSLPDLSDPDNVIDGEYLQTSSNAYRSLSSVEGYQPAFSDYMSDIPRSYGSLSPRGSLSHWLLNRDFANVQSLSYSSSSLPEVHLVREQYNGSSYVFPTNFQVPFVDNAPGATNFFVQVVLDIRARRPFSKKALPTL